MRTHDTNAGSRRLLIAVGLSLTLGAATELQAAPTRQPQGQPKSPHAGTTSSPSGGRRATLHPAEHPQQRQAAPPTACTDLPEGVKGSFVAYFSGTPTPPGSKDFECDGDTCLLRGWLYVPHSRRLALPGHVIGRPAVVFNHGHSPKAGEPCAIARYFTAAGFVVFAPLQRGVTESRLGLRNTGIYIDDYVAQQEAQGKDRETAVAGYLRDLVRDVEHAIAYLGGSDPAVSGAVDVERVAVMGHSNGGQLTIYASAAPVKAKAALDLSGLELAWDDGEPSAPKQEAAAKAVRDRRLPIFFAQPANARSVGPTLTLSNAAGSSGNHEMQAGLFPAVEPKAGECGANWQSDDDCAGTGRLGISAIHNRFAQSDSEVRKWGPAALAFFALYGVAP